jgi:RNA polymerase sigma-70 factor (ECF subfamily)
MWTADITLTRRLLAADAAAFDEFFAAFFPRLYRFALARLNGDDDAAEEVVQSTLIRGLNKLHTYRGEAALLTWLCSVCRREIAAYRERTGKYMEWVWLDEAETSGALDALALAASDDPEAQMRRGQLAQLVQATLDHLPGRYGEALEWRYIEGHSVEEIASRLGLGYKATESLLSRARQAFREGFQPC